MLSEVSSLRQELNENESTQEFDKLENWIYLFCSFDLTNSTEYKSRHPGRWAYVFSQFFEFVEKQLSNEEANRGSIRFKPWKHVGDEILLKLCVKSPDDIFFAPIFVFDVMNQSIAGLRDACKKDVVDLSVKSTIWLAKVDKIPGSTSQVKDENIFASAKNIVTTYSNIPHNDFDDFLGNDIDAGFRISRYSARGRLAVSANIAYILLLNRDSIFEKCGYDPLTTLHIVDYQTLKGIWFNRKYPIIWFDRDWKIEEMFYYDEEHQNETISRIKSDARLEKPEHNIQHLTKILTDVKLKDEYDELEKLIHELSPSDSNMIQPGDFRTSEVHCVAICFNDSGKVLLAKRSENKKVYPNRWEFGCGQLVFQKTFGESLKEDYHNDFQINLRIVDNPQPIASYNFTKDGRKIPGVIFFAETSDERISYNASKHQIADFYDPEEALELPENDCIPEFREVLTRAIEVRKSKSNSSS